MSKEEFIRIGTIDFTTFYPKVTSEMTLYAELNLGKKLNVCDIDVYSGERSIPHFHIVSQNSDFVSCPLIFEPLYFNHKGKTGRLSSNQLKFLDTYLRQIEPTNPDGLTRWQIIAYTWKQFNPDFCQGWYDPMTYPQPDYNKTVNMRSK